MISIALFRKVGYSSRFFFSDVLLFLISFASRTSAFFIIKLISLIRQCWILFLNENLKNRSFLSEKISFSIDFYVLIFILMMYFLIHTPFIDRKYSRQNWLDDRKVCHELTLFFYWHSIYTETLANVKLYYFWKGIASLKIHFISVRELKNSYILKKTFLQDIEIATPHWDRALKPLLSIWKLNFNVTGIIMKHLCSQLYSQKDLCFCVGGTFFKSRHLRKAS